MKKGFIFAIIATIISGWAVFINKFALSNWTSSDLYTTEKNVIAALFLASAILLFKSKSELLKLKSSQWIKLIIIGLVGGSIPFILFFKGLSISPSSGAAFWNKTLFIWVAIFAIPLLKEKFSKTQLFAFLLLIFGNLGLFLNGSLKFDNSTILVLSATLFWAIEYVLAKKFMENISPLILSWGRMFFGSLFLIFYLSLFSGSTPLIHLSFQQIPWLLIVGVTLTFYVVTWYSTLKKIPATYAAAILTAASPITTLLNNTYTNTPFPKNFFFYFLISLIGIIFLIFSSRKPVLKQTVDF